MFNRIKIYFLLFFVVFLNIYETLASSKPQEISSNLLNTIELYKSGRYIDIIELSYNLNFNTIGGMLLLAKSYEDMGYYNRAYRKYREIYTRYPTYKAFIYYFIARLFVEMEDYSEALKWYRVSLAEFMKLKSNRDYDWDFFVKKVSSDIFNVYMNENASEREVKQIFKSISDNFIPSYYYLSRVCLEDKSYKKGFLYAKKLINSDVNRYYKIDLLKRLTNNEKTLSMFLNAQSLSPIELLEDYGMYYEMLKVFNFIRNKQGKENLYGKEIALCYYKIGDYKNALISYNMLYHRTKNPDFLIKIAYSYYNLNREKAAKRYLNRYLYIKKYRFRFSFDAFYLKILFEIKMKDYQNAVNDINFVIKKYGPLNDIDRFIYRTFYLLVSNDQLENAIKIVFLYHPYVKSDYYKSWANYILGLFLDSRYFANAILSYPGSFYYFKSIKYVKVPQNQIKIADRFYKDGDFDKALKHYILLYASGYHKEYIKAKIENILKKKRPYKYLLQLKYFNYDNSFIYKLYFLGLFKELKEIFSDISENVDTPERYFIYYILAKIYYEENDYKKGLLYAEIISNSLKYIIFLPNNLITMLYPLMYEKKIKEELLKSDWFVDECFVMSIIREESRYDKMALSDRGAIGLMQLMPDTASWIYKRKISKRKLLNPEFNIEVGIKFLNYLYNKFTDYSLILASYNGGPTNVIRWLKKYGNENVDRFIETIPYPETRNFVKKVYTTYSIYKEAYPRLCIKN